PVAVAAASPHASSSPRLASRGRVGSYALSNRRSSRHRAILARRRRVRAIGAAGHRSTSSMLAFGPQCAGAFRGVLRVGDFKTEMTRAWQLSWLAGISFRYHCLRVIGTAMDPIGGTKDQKAAQGLGRALTKYMRLEVEVVGSEKLQ